MDRVSLERRQVVVYAGAIALGALVGLSVPGLAEPLSALVWPTLAVLLYASFCRIPLADLPFAFRERDFMAALLAANFLAVPLVVLVLVLVLPDEAPLRLGVVMVLMVPCTDWYVTFTLLGRGDARLALAATPVLLVVQILLLPLFLGLAMGPGILDIVRLGPFLEAFLGLIAAPLALAFATELFARRDLRGVRLIEALGWVPVPALAVVLFLVAASQIAIVAERALALLPVAVAFAVYLLAAAPIGRAVARAFGLEAPAARAVAFSVGTRNSFVVLPFALALPPGFELTAAVIVLQSLIELAGMTLYLRWVPEHLIPDDDHGT